MVRKHDSKGRHSALKQLVKGKPDKSLYGNTAHIPDSRHSAIGETSQTLQHQLRLKRMQGKTSNKWCLDQHAAEENEIKSQTRGSISPMQSTVSIRE